ncbi:uncharacterized protein B0T15DRAFT_213079 [Chaetomium strumarium]|uniref:Uncharacterized protein n=1 Tax=Chaetomium strumarium TaxID=1170767 RepID=A0AAJ0M1T9_9PEZI|nr:hypothetical protein B0T15DRAFT_213079 [Chaetomium strumarium]
MAPTGTLSKHFAANSQTYPALARNISSVVLSNLTVLTLSFFSQGEMNDRMIITDWRGGTEGRQKAHRPTASAGSKESRPATKSPVNVLLRNRTIAFSMCGTHCGRIAPLPPRPLGPNGPATFPSAWGKAVAVWDAEFRYIPPCSLLPLARLENDDPNFMSAIGTLMADVIAAHPTHCAPDRGAWFPDRGEPSTSAACPVRLRDHGFWNVRNVFFLTD